MIISTKIMSKGSYQPIFKWYLITWNKNNKILYLWPFFDKVENIDFSAKLKYLAKIFFSLSFPKMCKFKKNWFSSKKIKKIEYYAITLLPNIDFRFKPKSTFSNLPTKQPHFSLASIRHPQFTLNSIFSKHVSVSTYFRIIKKYKHQHITTFPSLRVLMEWFNI